MVVKALKEKGFIYPDINRRVLARLLNEEIFGLNLGRDGKTLDNTDTTGYKKYHTKLLYALP